MSHYKSLFSAEADQLVNRVAMNLLVRQAMLAQPEAEVAPLEALENDREKRGKIFLPTLF